jgi:hypothetical protein
VKRKAIIKRLVAHVVTQEDRADEAAKYGLYADAASYQNEASGVRRALALLDPDGNHLGATEDYWHYSQRPDWTER